ncbi:MAG: hypothetical protein WBR13_05780 [Allosphingosinicella sp.]
MKRRFAAALLLIAGATPAAAQDFTCSNKSAEISCDGGACKVNSDGFTPMSLGRTGNRLSICAYSGCWEGPILVRRPRGSIDLLYAQVRNSQASAGGGMNELAIIYDRGSRTAQMRWGGFANSMDCGDRD